NCTVSLMLMAIAPLFEQRWMDWISVATYQAASGAGARNMRELVQQMGRLGTAPLAQDPRANILDLDRQLTELMQSESFPTSEFGAPLAGSLLPWIDRAVDDGQT